MYRQIKGVPKCLQSSFIQSSHCPLFYFVFQGTNTSDIDAALCVPLPDPIPLLHLLRAGS